MKKFKTLVSLALTAAMSVSLFTACAAAAPAATAPAESAPETAASEETAPAGEAAGAAAETAGTSDEGPILVGMEIGTDGVFESKDEAGNPYGVSVQLAEDFGKWLGRDIEIVDIAWDGLIPSLQTNKIDMILSSMTITEERSKKVHFSDPYCNAYLAVLASADSGVESVEDLNQAGKKIAVTTGSTGYTYAMNNLTNAEVLTFDTAGACITEIVQGKADGFIRDQLTVYKSNQQNPDTTKAILIPIQDAEPWGAAFNLENDALREKFNEFLAWYEADGGYDRITETYMKEYKEAFDELGFKWFFD